MRGLGDIAADIVILQQHIELLPQGSEEPTSMISEACRIDLYHLRLATKHKYFVIVWCCPAAVINKFLNHNSRLDVLIRPFAHFFVPASLEPSAGDLYNGVAVEGWCIEHDLNPARAMGRLDNEFFRELLKRNSFRTVCKIIELRQYAGAKPRFNV